MQSTTKEEYRHTQNNIPKGERRRKIGELKKGDVFRVSVGDEENRVTCTLLDIQEESGYLGARLTVRRANDGQIETLYGVPTASVITERETNEIITDCS